MRRECQLLDTKFNNQIVTIDDLQKQLAFSRAAKEKRYVGVVL